MPALLLPKPPANQGDDIVGPKDHGEVLPSVPTFREFTDIHGRQLLQGGEKKKGPRIMWIRGPGVKGTNE